MFTAALWRTLPAYFHWRRLSTHTFRASTTGEATPSDRARFSSVRSQNRSFARFAPNMYESSMNGSLVRSSAWTWTTVSSWSR